MTDVKADEKTGEKVQAGTVDRLALNLAQGRVALGVAAFVLPGVTVKLLGFGGGSDQGRDLVTRMFAAREIALGAGYLLSKDAGRRTWTRIGLAVDALDTVSGLRSRRGRAAADRAVPLWAAAFFTAAAAGATVVGAAKVAGDGLR